MRLTERQLRRIVKKAILEYNDIDQASIEDAIINFLCDELQSEEVLPNMIDRMFKTLPFPTPDISGTLEAMEMEGTITGNSAGDYSLTNPSDWCDPDLDLPEDFGDAELPHGWDDVEWL